MEEVYLLYATRLKGIHQALALPFLHLSLLDDELPPCPNKETGEIPLLRPIRRRFGTRKGPKGECVKDQPFI
jgi:hypothetical protein